MLTCGVWVGCEDRAAHFRTTALGQGARTALPVFGLFMQKVYGDTQLLYHAIVTASDRWSKPGYDFTIPAAYIGDPSGCNETKRDSVMTLDFD